MAQNEATGHYNSLQIDLNSQFTKDLQLRAYYTLSRSIDPSTGGSGQDLNAVTNPYLGWRYDLGPSIFDRTHNFSANFIYTLPVFRDASSRMTRSLLGGWQVSGIVTIESGIPVNISDGNPIANNVVGNGNRPDLTGSIKYMHQVVGPQKVQFIDPTAFTSVTAPGTFGNLGHNALRGPGPTTGTSLSSRPLPSRRRAASSSVSKPSTPLTTPSSRVLITISVRVPLASSPRPILRGSSSSPGRFTSKQTWLGPARSNLLAGLQVLTISMIRLLASNKVRAVFFT